MSGVALVPGKSQVSDANGNPLAGGTVDVYLAGTTTRTNSWQDQALTTLNTNPIVLDASGSCSMWLDGSTLYKIVVKNAAGAVQSHLGGDNISGASGSVSFMTFLQSGSGAVARNAQSKMRELVSVKDFGAVGDGTTDDTTALQLAINLSSTSGFVALVPAGTYKHTGLTFKSGSRLRGHGSNCVRLLNSHATNDSLSVPYFNDGVFFEGWEMSGMTLDAQNVRSPSQAGFRLDTCRGGVVRDIVTKNHYYGWREKSAWRNSFENIVATANEYMALVESGATTGGVPNFRYGIYGRANTNGVDVQDKGLSATVFCGGAIEGSTNWALRILGAENRAVKFIGFNFEDNNNAAAGFDVILGDDAVSTSGPVNIDFDSCQFTDSDLSGTRIAFDWNRGSGVSVKNCNLVGYLRGADISSNFGAFYVENIRGPSNWAESATTGVFIPGPSSGRITGTKSSALHTDGVGAMRLYQSASTSVPFASRRTTEGFDRFEIDAAGKLGWHPFNTATADVTLGRINTKTCGTDGAFSFGQMATASLPAAGLAGAGAVAYDSTIGALVTSTGSLWLSLGVRVSVPATATSTGVSGQWAADSSFFYVCTATDTWRRVAIAAW